MNRTATLAVAVAAVAPFAVIAEDAAAEPTARVEYSDAFTSHTPNTSSGRVFRDEFFNAGDASAKPPSVQHVRLQLPKGARFHTSAVPACTASDAQLMAEGAAACDPKSQVGSEVFTFDTGVDGPTRLVPNDIAFINNKDELIILSQERQSGARVVTRARVTAGALDFELPTLPGTPPDGGADKREVASFPPSPWVTTPPTCSRSGKWTFRVDYTFRNGEKVTRTSDSPCTRPRIAFFHLQHGRTVKVYASAATTQRLRMFRGGKRVYSAQVQLQRGVNRLQLPALAKGLYRLTLGGRGASVRIR